MRPSADPRPGRCGQAESRTRQATRVEPIFPLLGARGVLYFLAGFLDVDLVHGLDVLGEDRDLVLEDFEETTHHEPLLNGPSIVAFVGSAHFQGAEGETRDDGRVVPEDAELTIGPGRAHGAGLALKDGPFRSQHRAMQSGVVVSHVDSSCFPCRFS